MTAKDGRAGGQVTISLSQRLSNHLHVLFRGRLRCYDLALSLVNQKAGLEIGGPSDMFRKWPAPLPLYERVASLDNCDFSRTTVWARHQADFVFSPHKVPGKIICNEGSHLLEVADHAYDFVLSCHNLEHFANPVKALKEWQRVTRPRGGLILVLPDRTKTFDHFRPPTPVAHMLEDYARNTQEDDLTHLPEILQLHDFSMDPEAGSMEEFHQRSLNNLTNRCLHHHVFNEDNSRDLLVAAGLEVLATETVWPNSILLVARF
jgi:SAM-dependent methyltransferase